MRQKTDVALRATGCFLAQEWAKYRVYSTRCGFFEKKDKYALTQGKHQLYIEPYDKENRITWTFVEQLTCQRRKKCFQKTKNCFKENKHL